MPRYKILSTNCDCASDLIARTAGQIKQWLIGPRCPGCHQVLGLMQWGCVRHDDAEVSIVANGEWDALHKYKQGIDTLQKHAEGVYG